MADNVCTTGGLQTRSVEEATFICGNYLKRQYTHGPSGPYVDPGYHGLDPGVDFRRDNGDAVADMLQFMWDQGVIPCCFIMPDNWRVSDMQTPRDGLPSYESILLQPRFQRLIKFAVIGWEPSQDRSNAEWVECAKWLASVLPNAKRFIHMFKDMDCPGNNDDLTPSSGKWIGPAECWRRVAPYLRGFLGQYGPFDYDPYFPQNAEQADRVNEWRKVCREHRFRDGTAGWPRFSQDGPDVPMLFILSEYGSYWRFWPLAPAKQGAITEAAAQHWGDIALQEGADGVLDGFTAS